jgi:hypothetical protein
MFNATNPNMKRCEAEAENEQWRGAEDWNN